MEKKFYLLTVSVLNMNGDNHLLSMLSDAHPFVFISGLNEEYARECRLDNMQNDSFVGLQPVKANLVYSLEITEDMYNKSKS